MASVTGKDFRKLVRQNFTLGGTKLSTRHLKLLGRQLEKHPRLGRGYVADPRKSLSGVTNPFSREKGESAAKTLYELAKRGEIKIGDKTLKVRTGVTKSRLQQSVRQLVAPAADTTKAQLANQQAQQEVLRARALRVAEIQRSLQAEREKQGIGPETSVSRNAISQGILHREVSSLDLGKVNGPLTSAGKPGDEPLGLNAVPPTPTQTEAGQGVAPAVPGKAAEDDDAAAEPGTGPAAKTPKPPPTEGDDQPPEPTDLAID